MFLTLLLFFLLLLSLESFNDNNVIMVSGSFWLFNLFLSLDFLINKILSWWVSIGNLGFDRWWWGVERLGTTCVIYFLRAMWLLSSSLKHSMKSICSLFYFGVECLLVWDQDICGHTNMLILSLAWLLFSSLAASQDIISRSFLN